MSSEQFKVLVGVELDRASLNSLKTQIQNVGDVKIDVKADTSGVAQNVKSQVRQCESEFNRLSSRLKNSIKFKVDTGDLKFQVHKVSTEFDKLQISSKEAKAAIDRMKTAESVFNELYQGFNKGTVSAEKMADAYRELQVASKAASNAVKTVKLNEVSDIDRNNAILGAKNWLKDNSKAAVKFKGEIDRITRAMETCDATTFGHLKKELDNVKKKAKEAGLTGQTMGDKLKTKFKEYGAYFSVANLAMEITQGIRYMYQAVSEVDKAMTELKRVTDLSDAQYSNLYDDLTVSAREYGVALNDLVSATADWARAGFDANTAKGLAEVTTMYQHIADVDYATAVQNLLTAYKGFEGELKGMFGTDTVAAVGYIGDILNE